MKSSVLSTPAQRKPAAEHEKASTSPSANPVSQLQQSIHNSERMTAQRKGNSSIQRKGEKEKKKK